MSTVTQLNRKAMLVTLTIKKPATVRRDQAAEQVVQSTLQDASLSVSSKLFRDKSNPIRVLLNEYNDMYAYHRQNTLPWKDRGARLLPLTMLDSYRDGMRVRQQSIESKLHTYLPMYDQLVKNDVAYRLGMPYDQIPQATQFAKCAEYPAADEFKDKLASTFYFEPLPDNSHWLFDMSDEDKNALEARMNEAVIAARQDMVVRMHEPLAHLAKKLAVPIGQDGAIFRDSSLENILEACGIVYKLAMDDPEVTAMVDEVVRTVTPYSITTHQLRESPIVRSAAAEKLAAVAAKMAAFGG